MTLRCVVCGSLPTEECNQRTHDVHYKLWVDVLNSPGIYANVLQPIASEVVGRIEEARAFSSLKQQLDT